MSEIEQFSRMRAIDANLNRCAEGLRVVEDVFRFAVEDAFLAKELKGIRHELADLSQVFGSRRRIESRDSQNDVGRESKNDAEYVRESVGSIATANFKRIVQSLRSLEEFSKGIDTDRNSCVTKDEKSTTVAQSSREVSSGFERIRYRIYGIEKAASGCLFECALSNECRLCVMVDARESEHQFCALINDILKCGRVMIQFRDKDADDRRLVSRGKLLEQLVRTANLNDDKNAIWIFNDRPDLSLVCRADGVHLGQDDLSVADARSIVGPDKIVGVSTHDIGQVERAVLDGANYIGVGPMFRSSTKHIEKLAGLEFAAEVAEFTTLPAFAIGGINIDNIDRVLGTGISRVAVAAAICESDSPGQAAEHFSRRLHALSG